MKNIEIISSAVSLILKAALLAANWVGKKRKVGLEEIVKMDVEEKNKEIVFLRDRIYQLETQVSILQKQMNKKKSGNHNHYSLKERFYILWYMEYFQIPRRKVSEYFGITRSTLYWWLHKIDEMPGNTAEPVNKTPDEIALFIWEISKKNIDWGRVRITNQLALLKIFISASTVRNILS